MIPKIIHYCWFGGKELPQEAKECIESWKKFLPSYEIKRWDESSFDVNSCKYTNGASEEKKWAFVSDYARFWILYNYGGVYFDTDVELIAPIDDIIEKGPFMGCEPSRDGKINVNPGLGLAANPGCPFLKNMLKKYNTMEFKSNKDGKLDTIVDITTEALLKEGYVGENEIETVAGYNIYPTDYFCPMNPVNGKLIITENTCSIHHYSASWQSKYSRLKTKVQRCIGENMTEQIISLKKFFLKDNTR